MGTRLANICSQYWLQLWTTIWVQISPLAFHGSLWCWCTLCYIVFWTTWLAYYKYIVWTKCKVFSCVQIIYTFSFVYSCLPFLHFKYSPALSMLYRFTTFQLYIFYNFTALQISNFPTVQLFGGGCLCSGLAWYIELGQWYCLKYESKIIDIHGRRQTTYRSTHVHNT